MNESRTSDGGSLTGGAGSSGLEWEPRSRTLKGSTVRSTRTKGRSERIRRLRERCLTNSGASPDCLALESGDDESGEERGTEPIRTDGQDMSEDFKKFVESVSAKLDNLPTADQFNAFGYKIDKNTESIKANTDRIIEQDRKIAGLSASLERVEREQVDARRGLDGRVRTIIEDGPAASAAGAGGGRGSDEEAYDKARRSICFWPVDGNEDEQLRAAAADFIKNALMVDERETCVEDILSVRRAPDKSRSLVHKEIVVELRDQKTRDFIASRGNRLAPYVDSENKPTCGMRMSIPTFLEPAFRLLKRYGFHLKDVRGSGVKSNVRFDDFKRSVFLQVRFPGERDFMNVYPEEAHAELRAFDAKKNARTRSLTSPGSGSSPKRKRRTVSDAEGGMDLDKEEEVFIVQKSTWRPAERKEKR